MADETPPVPKGLRDFFSATKWLWAAIILVGGIITGAVALAARAATISALPAHYQSNIDSFMAHTRRMDVMAQMQTEDRQTLDNIQCYVEVLAKVEGRTLDECALQRNATRNGYRR